MSDKDDFTLDIELTSRAQMDPGTPRQGGWTYHHVQPVRIYYLTAAILLRIATRSECWNTTRKVCVDAVKRMCQYKSNEQTAERFVYEREWSADGADDAACAPIAKFCGSPPCGGFPGPNPLQRSDDPHELAETRRPRSADPVWWDSVRSLGPLVYDAMGIHALPDGPATIRHTRPGFDWHRVAHLLAAAVHSADAAGAPQPQHRDWCLDNGNVWTYLSRARMAQPITRGGPMRLLRAGEQRSYIDTDDTPLANLVQRGAALLTRNEDFYVLATP